MKLKLLYSIGSLATLLLAAPVVDNESPKAAQVISQEELSTEEFLEAVKRHPLAPWFTAALKPADVEEETVELEKRRGGSGGRGGGGGGSSGGSRGGSSSSGRSGSSGSSRGGSGSSGSGSSGSSATRGRSLTPMAPNRYGYYGGGAAVPFMAGAVSAAGLVGVVVLASAVGSHYPGYWGRSGDNVYDYSYNTTLNGTDYHVTCYCIKNDPCSCEKANSSDYFDNLPSNISKVEKKDNYTQVYINGTLPPANSSKASSSDSSVVKLNSLFVVGLASTVYMLL